MIMINTNHEFEMARYPNVFCLQCGSNKKMVYDAVISTLTSGFRI